jgi:UDP-N-acetylmuramoyl-tripeptide--D-alanyl-D-alanine ligase
MITGSLALVSAWINAQPMGDDVTFRGVSTDSRTLTQGQLFVALSGDHFNGHDYVQQAAARGASAAIVERYNHAVMLPQLVVSNTQVALADLARHWCQQLHCKIAAITGSNGKTTVKTMLASILNGAGRTEATPGNLNNEIGLPLSLFEMERTSQYAVLEMGCGKPGDIAYLANIAPPDVALVNNVGPAHLERLLTVEGVAHAKSEIYAGLKPNGIGVLNANDAFAHFLEQRIGHRRSIRFGLGVEAEMTAENIQWGESTSFTLVTPNAKAKMTLPLPGRHNLMNALAASSMAYALEVDIDLIRQGLESVQGVNGRLTRHASAKGWVLVDDTYNANPASVKAGIDALMLAPGEAWLVLGDMKELGGDEAELHADVGRYARTRGVARLWVTGQLSQHAASAFGEDARVFSSRQSLAEQLATDLRPGVHVLVKGSRSSGMEAVVKHVLTKQGLVLGAPAYVA